MTDLSDFLKVKKVRCVSIGNYKFITVGKEYDVVGLTRNSVFIVNDDESENIYPYKHFEPVLDSAENPLQNIELTPEFEVVEPKFKVGDKVYYGSEPDVLTILEFDVDGWARMDSWAGFVDSSRLCHATLENYERLQATFPNIKFEAPPKPLTGSDLCRAIKAKGKKFIICAVSDISEEDAINNYLNGDEEMDVIFEIDDELDHPFIAIWGNLYKFAVPLSEETGEPLTESILND